MVGGYMIVVTTDVVPYKQDVGGSNPSPPTAKNAIGSI